MDRKLTGGDALTLRPQFELRPANERPGSLKENQAFIVVKWPRLSAPPRQARTDSASVLFGLDPGRSVESDQEDRRLPHALTQWCGAQGRTWCLKKLTIRSVASISKVISPKAP